MTATQIAGIAIKVAKAQQEIEEVWCERQIATYNSDEYKALTDRMGELEQVSIDTYTLYPELMCGELALTFNEAVSTARDMLSQ